MYVLIGVCMSQVISSINNLAPIAYWEPQQTLQIHLLIHKVKEMRIAFGFFAIFLMMASMGKHLLKEKKIIFKSRLIYNMSYLYYLTKSLNEDLFDTSSAKFWLFNFVQVQCLLRQKLATNQFCSFPSARSSYVMTRALENMGKAIMANA